MDDFFLSYEEWRDAMDGRCNIALPPDYCEERVNALRDTKNPSTKMFIELFGLSYRDKVVSWFERAGAGG
mgnify:CR=1|jgi:hypothetical protein